MVQIENLDLFPNQRERWFPAAQRRALKRLVEWAPRRPYCSDDLDYGLRIRTVGRAFEHRYIQWNPPGRVRWLIEDIDRPLDPAIERFPVGPTLLLINPASGHGKAAWEIREPVHTHPSARSGPKRWLESIQSRLTTAVDGDSGFARLVAQNPLHPDYQVVRVGRGNLQLNTFERALRGVEPAPSPDLDGSEGRNCALFDSVRHFAYRAKAQADSHGALYVEVLEQAIRVNAEFPTSVGGPLPPNEVRNTAKSIAKWVWERYTGSGRTAAERKQDSRRAQGVIPREHYIAERADRRSEAALLKAQGLSYAQVAEQMNVSKDAARDLVRRAHGRR